MAASKASKRKKRAGNRPSVRRRRAPFSAGSIRALAMGVRYLADAERELESDEPLTAIFEKYPKLKAAWQRGRLLRDLRGLAAAAATIGEAAQSLGMTSEQLRKRLDEDLEVRDTWNQARLATTITVKAALVKEAQKGKSTAVAHVMAVLRREIATPRVDFRRLTVNQTEEATGYTRQTLHLWATQKGAPKNADGSFSLPALFAWHEDLVMERAGGPPSERSLATMDPLKRAKADKLERELQVQRAQLLDRRQVVAGLVARHQVLVTATHRKAAELGVLLEGHKAAKIIETLEEVFADMRRQMLQVPDVLRLPPALRKEFAAFMEKLDGLEAA